VPHSPDTRDIDSVLTELERIIDDSVLSQSRLGYFAAMYQQITREIKASIANAEFEDAPRALRLDQAFARHYFAALAAKHDGKDPLPSWAVAFDASHSHRHIALQHLLLGVNAHLNVDLAVAVSELAGDASPLPLQADFDRICAVFADLLDRTQQALLSVSPWLMLLDALGDPREMLLAFSVDEARHGAWQFAEQLAATPLPDRPELIAKRSRVIAELGRSIVRPGFRTRWLRRLIRTREARDPRRIIHALS
jgi:uncharacterized protein DUF5995